MPEIWRSISREIKRKHGYKAENFTNMIVKIVKNASTNFCGTISLFMQERQWGCSEFVQ